jgi:hypothetical protein
MRLKMVCQSLLLFEELFLLLSIVAMSGGKRANTLQKVDVPILANKDCQQWYKDEKKSLTIINSALCAGLENGGKDSCQVGRIGIFLRNELTKSD